MVAEAADIVVTPIPATVCWRPSALAARGGHACPGPHQRPCARRGL